MRSCGQMFCSHAFSTSEFGFVFICIVPGDHIQAFTSVLRCLDGTCIAKVTALERQRVGCRSLREVHDCARSSDKWVGTRWLVGSAAGVWLRSPPFYFQRSRCAVLSALFTFDHPDFIPNSLHHAPRKIIFPSGIRGFLVCMNLFHRAGIVVAKERTGQSGGESPPENQT
jgi:hypothetical protein